MKNKMRQATGRSGGNKGRGAMAEALMKAASENPGSEVSSSISHSGFRSLSRPNSSKSSKTQKQAPKRRYGRKPKRTKKPGKPPTTSNREEVISVKMVGGVTYTKTKALKDPREERRIPRKVKQGVVTTPVERKPEPLKIEESVALGKVLEKKLAEYPYLGFTPRWKRYHDVADGEVDLIIGLDFGTTFTKVVISEPASGNTWVVPLSSNRQNPYLLKSEVYLDGDTFSLQPRGEKISALKMPFLSGSVFPDDAARVIAYLALLIDYAKHWFLNEQRDYLQGLEPIWSLNMGLPARNFDNKILVDQYLEVASGAFYLAMVMPPVLTDSLVKQAHRLILSAFDKSQQKIPRKGELFYYQSQVNVYPEIMAQLYGFLRSKSWDRHQPEFMMVDIGGGTVDSTIFNVIKEQGTNEFEFHIFTSGVQHKGTLKLHEERLYWIRGELEKLQPGDELLGAFKRMTGPLSDYWLIPGEIAAYLEHADFGDFTLDHFFLGGLKKELYSNQLRYILQHVNPNFWKKRRNYPLILVGGGSSNPVYQGLLETGVNVHGVSIERLDLPVPTTLVSKLAPEVYHRVSVAFGLAFENLGKIITPDKIKDLEMRDSGTGKTWEDNYVSQEMT